ncbi:MAG: major facilitator superfamily 1 [Myxococcaceae bacterium]|nr:major facilitator superfamily 1 [Myxococcaceae bacterium]
MRPRADVHGAASASALRLLRLSYVGFISLGLPDTVLGAAWPSMQQELQLPLDAAGAILLVTTLGVVLSSVASGRLRARWGTGAVLLGSTALAACALLAMSLAQSGLHVLAIALCAGLGGGAIDASLNDYVARNHSARQLTWLHACWGIGAATAPLIVGGVLAQGHSFRVAYVALAALELSLALAFLRTRTEWTSAAAAPPSARVGPPAQLRGTAHASVALFYVYGGLESGTGLWVSSLLLHTRQATVAAASAAGGVFWGALMLGRVASGLYADQLGAARLLRWGVYCAAGASLLLALPGTPSWLFMVALGALGAALAPIYPLAMHDTPRRYGEPEGSRLVGYQVAAASLGTATLPWLLGATAARTSLTLLPGLLAALSVLLIALEKLRRETVRSGGSR